MSVHITGLGAVTSLGRGVLKTYQALKENQTHIERVDDWAQIDGLNSHVAAFCKDYDSKEIPRKFRRTMSKMSELSCLAADEALAQANLTPTDLKNKRVAIILGSTTGSPIEFESSQRKFHKTDSVKGQLSTTVFKCMSHSSAVNLAAYLDFKGMVLSPAAACATGAQCILLGKQMIETGLFDIAIVGGTDECHITSCFSFDVAHAASRGFNHTPDKASRPFDKNRDGIVVSEGASILVLESTDSKKSRNAISLGKVIGGSMICDGEHISRPIVNSMAETMKNALDDAGITPEDIGYINAHATSTALGDLRESQAVYDVFGSQKLISSIKGHLGHSFAASGSTEAAMGLMMLKEKLVIGTRNLEEVDPDLPNLNYFTGVKDLKSNYILSNNFAFGGINVSLIFSSDEEESK